MREAIHIFWYHVPDRIPSEKIKRFDFRRATFESRIRISETKKRIECETRKFSQIIAA